ncbi:DNA primase [Spirulina major CS-329]|uniref:DNA primase n=1 Tax=Spirulina TaxID=1154 RepID=UPI00232D5E96|nr:MULTISPECIES: DNA primase [Spirulina]MDB9495952.1 DNA primase [Spirulina subsalsa CS-330]MDB9502833.1 DNA primase [Spirulina major CS-329]
MDIPRLHPDTIQDVEDRADILDVVGEHVVLKKQGKDYLGLCPFHDEKTPSFSVSPTKQLYYCFGCGAGGGAIKFLMEVGQQSFVDVVLRLAERYQVPIKTLAPEKRQELQRQLSLREQLYEILAIAASFYQHALRQPEGEIALTYLTEKRRLSDQTIQTFGLGYAPGGWEALYRYLVEGKRYPVLLVEQAGLVRPRKQGEGYYDYFRDRLMIPIADHQGRIIGFGSRTLGNDEPKYLNSPETEVFSKGQTLYGLDRAKKAIAQQDQAVLVEGYFDVIALHAAGIEQAVAALGTALGEAQLKHLSRYTDSKQIVLNFDADAAGRKATERAIREVETLVYTGQIQLRILNLPGGKDADEFLLSRPDAVEQYRHQLQTAPLWLDWQLEQVVQGLDLNQADQFEQAAQGMLKLLQKIADPQKRTYYLNICAEKLGQGDRRLILRYSQDLGSQLRSPKRSRLQPQKRSDRNLLERAEELLLFLYLHCPGQRPTIIADLDQRDLMFSLSHHRQLWQQILTLDPDQRNPRLIQALQAQALQAEQSLDNVQHLFHLSEHRRRDIERAGLLVKAAIASLERVSYEKNRTYCLHHWQTLDPQTDPETHAYYLNEFYRNDQKIRELDQQRCASLLDVIELAPE